LLPLLLPLQVLLLPPLLTSGSRQGPFVLSRGTADA